MPVYILGYAIHWDSFDERIDDMKKRGTVKNGELKFTRVKTPAELMTGIEARLIGAPK